MTIRIVTTSDTHKPVDPAFIPDGDVFIHAGDLMRTGYPDDFARQLEWLDKLPHKTKLYVPGNHDFHLKVYPGPALQELRDVGVTVIGFPGNDNYNTYKLANGKVILGLPYVENLPRWAFNIKPKKLKKFLESYSYSQTPNIIVSHMPIHGILDLVGTQNRGSKTYSEYLNGMLSWRDLLPEHWIHGHIHEGYGTAQVSTMTIHNVAMCDRNYNHVNPPMVIDV